MSPEQEYALIDLLRQVKELLDEHGVEFWLDCGTLLGAVRDGKFIPWEHDIDLGSWRDNVPEAVKTSVSEELRNRGFEVSAFENHIHIGIGKEKIHADINLYRLSDGKAIMPRSGPVNSGDRFLAYLSEVLSAPYDYEVDLKEVPITKNLVKASLVKIGRALPSSLRKRLAKFLSTIYEKIGCRDVSWAVPSDCFTNLSTVRFYGMEFRIPAKAEEYLTYRYGEDWNVPKREWRTNTDDGAVISSSGKRRKRQGLPGKLGYLIPSVQESRLPNALQPSKATPGRRDGSAMSDLPLLSIVTPSYNQGQFIEETILSVKNQDYPNIEHIIVDGGSTDNTLEVLKMYEGTYNMRWISEPDEGQADAVNKGFAMAKGEIIGWLNSDDVYFSKDTISTVVVGFQRCPGADFIYGDFVKIDHGNTILKVYHTWEDFSFQRLIRMCYISQPATFFRRDVIERLSLDVRYDYGMDIDFWFRASTAGYRFKYISKVLVAERIHDAAKCVAHPEKSRAEGVLLRLPYGQPREILHVRASDKLRLLIFRLKGTVTLLRLRASAHNNLAFEPRYEKLSIMLLRQFHLIRLFLGTD